jgi:hypothetical protein
MSTNEPFKVGDRVTLARPTLGLPVPKGTKGTVRLVRESGMYGVDFDNGVVPPFRPELGWLMSPNEIEVIE